MAVIYCVLPTTGPQWNASHDFTEIPLSTLETTNSMQTPAKNAYMSMILSTFLQISLKCSGIQCLCNFPINTKYACNPRDQILSGIASGAMATR